MKKQCIRKQVRRALSYVHEEGRSLTTRERVCRHAPRLLPPLSFLQLLVWRLSVQREMGAAEDGDEEEKRREDALALMTAAARKPLEGEAIHHTSAYTAHAAQNSRQRTPRRPSPSLRRHQHPSGVRRVRCLIRKVSLDLH